MNYINCNYCNNIQTTYFSTNSKQIEGVLHYFINKKTFKKYIMKCCLLKYAIDEPNKGEIFDNKIIKLMKIKNNKYVLANDSIPIILYELEFKNIEEFENPFMNNYEGPSHVIIHRNIILKEIPEKYEFISVNKYNNIINQSNMIISNEVKCQDIQRIYIIHDAMAIACNENVYKIGRTSQQDLSRFKNYIKGSKLIFLTICHDCNIIEKKIIQLFKSKYIIRKDRGAEYFQGDCISMIKDITAIVFN